MVETISFKFVIDDVLDECLRKSNNSIFECRTIINFYGHFSVVKLKWTLHLKSNFKTDMHNSYARIRSIQNVTGLNCFTLFQPEASKLKHSVHFVTRQILKCYLFQVKTGRTRTSYILRQPSQASGLVLILISEKNCTTL